MVTLRCGIHLGPHRGPCALCAAVQAEMRAEVLERQKREWGAHAAGIKRQKRIAFRDTLLRLVRDGLVRP